MNYYDFIKKYMDTDENLDNTKYSRVGHSFNLDTQEIKGVYWFYQTELKNLFKEKYGQTITEYTQRKRMKMAEMLLINTDIKIREIAKSVGYLSPSKFSTYYKRYMGIFPSEVRKMKK
ncbi:AraC family transcriptional regulator [uncultured Sneathia sp.]|uniref:helix-turn-helix domain-containing protein n=1 Tax=uncultured Sneathia sp. TaxID=278067 RepID=UPI00259738AF|nr:AraC family transcriptional regulator [uncultured Sneathia sp.]